MQNLNILSEMSFDFYKLSKKGIKLIIWQKFMAKFSDIWKLTQYIMYNIEIHKVLNGPKIKENYTIIFSAV